MAVDLAVQIREVENLVSERNYSRALQLADQLTSEYPDEAGTWTLRSYVRAQIGNLHQAIDDMDVAIGKCDREPDYFYTRGIIFFELKRYHEAIIDFTKVLDLCDDYDSDYYREGAHFFRADARVRTGDYEQAALDCSHLSDGMRTWTDRLRTKEEILAEAVRGSNQ